MRSSVALDICAVDGHGSAALVARRKAGLDEQRLERLESQRLVGAFRGARGELAGVFIDLYLVVMVDQGAR